MSGAKDAYQIDLSSEQIAFLRTAQEQYNIPDESKVVPPLQYPPTNTGSPCG